MNSKKTSQQTTYYLAVDIGASSGRHILCHLEQGKMIIEEMYRFPNGAAMADGHLVWDYEALFNNIVSGMKACADANKIPSFMGIDTWGVDYVLLDRNDKIVGKTYAYRDSRTSGMNTKLSEKLPFSEYFALTGIADQPFNTVYQLMSNTCDELNSAEHLLLTPDYLGYLLTGKMHWDYTDASTTGMLNAKSRTWDKTVLSCAGIPERILGKVEMPGTVLGNLKPDIARAVGFDCNVVSVAAHDTGSAYIAVPCENEHGAYLSSGTWSLFGVENDVPVTDTRALDAGFTNEGGFGGKIRLLKNIMGLWMLQCIRHETGDKYSFAEMAKMASDAPEVTYRVDVSDNRYLAPENMTAELQNAVKEQGGSELSLPQLLRMVNLSLADGYAAAAQQLEEITGNTYDTIHIVGGGCQNETLNQMTANASHRKVVAGPTEGTALGNLMVQMMCDGTFSSINDARSCLKNSFDVKTYYPQQ